MADATTTHVTVLGAGAVGCYFGGRLAATGVPVTLVGRAAHVEAIARDGLVIESARGVETIRVRATTDPAWARSSAIVLLCVKTTDTEDAASALVPHLAVGASLLSLQNGVDNVERIRTASGIDAFPAVVYVAAAMIGSGRVRHTGRGDLILGDLPPAASPERRVRLEAIARLFAGASVPCALSDDVARELWAKMVLNCAYNAVSALTGRRYREMADDREARDWMTQSALETVAVARGLGIELDETESLTAVWSLAAAMPEATSSTAQDLARGKRTEIDSLNGYVARMGAALGIPTPVNRMLHERVKRAEAA